MSDENIFPHLEKGVKRETFIFNCNVLMYHWKSILTINVMTYRKGSFNIPSQMAACQSSLVGKLRQAAILDKVQI